MHMYISHFRALCLNRVMDIIYFNKYVLTLLACPIINFFIGRVIFT